MEAGAQPLAPPCLSQGGAQKKTSVHHVARRHFAIKCRDQHLLLLSRDHIPAGAAGHAPATARVHVPKLIHASKYAMLKIRASDEVHVVRLITVPFFVPGVWLIGAKPTLTSVVKLSRSQACRCATSTQITTSPRITSSSIGKESTSVSLSMPRHCVLSSRMNGPSHSVSESSESSLASASKASPSSSSASPSIWPSMPSRSTLTNTLCAGVRRNVALGGPASSSWSSEERTAASIGDVGRGRSGRADHTALLLAVHCSGNTSSKGSMAPPSGATLPRPRARDGRDGRRRARALPAGQHRDTLQKRKSW
eukprot:scaffold157173_cov33-Tisochrysis_lutea.AAC.2